jgi:hypothetical protein
MSNVIDIKVLREKYSNQINSDDLRSFAESQHRTIESLCAENEMLKEKLAQLEGFLKQNTSLINVVNNVSDEEAICIQQITLLKNKSMNREMDLDEIKRLDLLVKNLRLAREKTERQAREPEYLPIKEADLVELAKSDNE